MSIYKLKLGFSDFLIIFGCSQGPWPSNEVLKLRKSDCLVGPPSNGHNLLNISPNLCSNWIPGCLISNKTNFTHSLWIKSYGQNSEEMSFFSIDFKTIWALLSCDYFQTIVNSLITFGWYISSSSLGSGTKIY